MYVVCVCAEAQLNLARLGQTINGNTISSNIYNLKSESFVHIGLFHSILAIYAGLLTG